MIEIKYISLQNINELENEFCSYFISKMNEIFTAGKKNAVTMLSGGKTPMGFYKKLAAANTDDFTGIFDFGKICFFLGDERNAAKDSDESNYGNVVKNLCGRAVSENQLMRVTNGFEAPVICSERYDKLIKEKAPDGIIDLLILGIGDDGHTASLFPGTIFCRNKSCGGQNFYNENENSVLAQPEFFISHYIPKLSAVRFTITEDIILKARNIAVILTGENKRRAIEMINDKILNETEVPAKLIFQTINPNEKKEVTFFTDINFKIM